MLNPREIMPGHSHGWPQSHHEKEERESCVISACLLWGKKYKGSTQHVPRAWIKNKQCTVNAWKQHSSNMVRPQIRDPGDRQEWNKCEGQEFELAQREPFFFAHKCHAGATESIQWVQLGTCKIRVKPGDSGTQGWKGGQQSMGKLCCLLIRPHKLNSARLVQYADGERADSCFLLMAS